VGDIAILVPLVSTAKQDHDKLAAPNKINSITRTVVDPHFRNAGSHGLHVTGIAERQSSNANCDAGTRLAIA